MSEIEEKVIVRSLASKLNLRVLPLYAPFKMRLPFDENEKARLKKVDRVYSVEHLVKYGDVVGGGCFRTYQYGDSLYTVEYNQFGEAMSYLGPLIEFNFT